MANATVFQGIQIGPESTPGTAVAATKKLLGISINPGIKAEVNTFRPSGNKYATVAALGKEWMEAGISSDAPTYDELAYLLASLVGDPVITTPLGATKARQHVFTPNADEEDDVITYTVEFGDANRGARFPYGLVTGLTLDVSRSRNSLSGSMIGQRYKDDVTLTTASVTSLPLVPILPSDCSIYLADTQAGLAGATALKNPFSGSWSLTGRHNPKWVLNRSNTSFKEHVEVAPELRANLLLEVDDEGMGLLTQLRSGATKWLRLEWIGQEIETNHNHSLQIDMACKVSSVEDFSDQDGIYAVGWEMTGAHDATWGKPFEITIVCTTTDIA